MLIVRPSLSKRDCGNSGQRSQSRIRFTIATSWQRRAFVPVVWTTRSMLSCSTLHTQSSSSRISVHGTHRECVPSLMAGGFGHSRKAESAGLLYLGVGEAWSLPQHARQVADRAKWKCPGLLSVGHFLARRRPSPPRMSFAAVGSWAVRGLRNSKLSSRGAAVPILALACHPGPRVPSSCSRLGGSGLATK